ncbi:Helix-turn-helix domain-containing protein [Parafrankia irregularis]|uniref:Helix-turn-helix domain-containing protein n=1 Tax=Parafrankia irregularis TaxID=795642 RepID=A0A0S4QXB8_9ACTN|nr:MULTISPECIES: helix-turn-helix domain-containing protein [Parafrankia]MBE3201426.1 helix-turn-helix domain-containing protein [Parafrankia sp. CH37]CUU60299.1 Helix-turn-helix domain-containing protein [Parafrankia irregularis]
MASSIPQRSAVSALYSHVRAIRLVPTVVCGRMVSVRVLRSTLLAIAYYLDAEDWSGAFPSMPTLAARAEVSESTARRAVRALEAIGILATERGGGRRSNRYRIVCPPGSVEEAEPAPMSSEAETSVQDRAPQSSGPTTFCRSTSRSPRRRTRRPRRPAAASRRGRMVPEDLLPLADALAARGLRASYALTAEQTERVRAALRRVGVGAMVSASYRAHRAADPARWWSAWLDLWSGLHAESVRSMRATPVGSASMPGDTAAGAAACRAALTAVKRDGIGRIPIFGR